MSLYYRVVTYVLSVVVGLCIGSFLNVVIYRVPLKMSVAKPASHCPGCKKPIAWYDNIPVVSYLLLGGKCRHCKMHIPFRYTAVELLNAVLWVLCVVCFYDSGFVYMLLCAACASVLICIFFIDLEHKLIFDRFQIMLAVLGIGAMIFSDSPYSGGERWLSNVIGGVAGYGLFLLIAWAGSKIAKREALGGGDIKLCGCMGLFLGWQRLILAVLIASVAGSLIILLLRVFKKNEDAEYPFAPFLTTGFMICILFGDSILSGYLSLLSI